MGITVELAVVSDGIVLLRRWKVIAVGAMMFSAMYESDVANK